MTKRIHINEDVCIGCRLCEIHCIVKHSKSGKILKAFRKGEPETPSRVRVEEKGHLSFAIQCRHCDEAPCLEACPTGAMYRDPETGAVLADSDKCVGCWMCIMVCPFGAIRQDVTSKKIASKCDLCGQDGTPVCVANCPNEALTFENDD